MSIYIYIVHHAKVWLLAIVTFLRLNGIIEQRYEKNKNRPLKFQPTNLLWFSSLTIPSGQWTVQF